MATRRVALPFHNFDLSNGIISKSRPEEIAGRAFIQADNVDEFDKYRAVGKTHGSTRRSDDASSAWESLHYFERFDLSGNLQRSVIGLTADGTVYLINSDNTLTSLDTGRTGEALSNITYNDRLHLAGPNNTPFKVDSDGFVSRWGVKAPGTVQTVLESFDDQSDWTINGTNTKADSTDVSADAEGSNESLQINKTDTSVSTVQVTKSGMSLDASDAGRDSLFLFVFFPGNGLAKLISNGSAVRVEYGDSGLSNSNIHDFEVGDFVAGWNLLTLPLNQLSTETTGTGAPLSAIDTLRVTVTFSSNAQTLNGIKLDHFYKNDDDEIVVHENGLGAITSGTEVRYRVSYLTYVGLESNASGFSEVRVAAGNPGSQFYLDSIPVSSDTQVVARRLYREEDGSNQPLFLDDIPNNINIGYYDNVPSFYLGSTTPFLLGDGVLDHKEPPPFSTVALYRNHVFGINSRDSFKLSFSNNGDPEVFPLLNQAQFDHELTGLVEHPAGLLVLASDTSFLIEGNDVEDFTFTRVHPMIGTSGRRSNVKTDRYPITVHDDGPYIVENPADPWFIGSKIKDKFEDLPGTAFQNAFMVHDRRRFRVLFFLQSTDGGNYDTMYSWSYGKAQYGQVTTEGGLDPLDVRLGHWHTVSLPSSIQPKCAAVVETTDDIPLVYIGGGDGYVYELGDEDSKNWATQTTSTGISMTLETSDVPIGATPSGRGVPRFIELNTQLDADTTFTITVTCRDDFDGDITTTNTFTKTLEAGNRTTTIAVPGQNFGSVARVKVENSEANVKPTITSLRLFFIPRTSLQGVR